VIRALLRCRPDRSAWLDALIEAERGRFVLWLPVAMGAGVAGYYALRSEPPVWLGAAGAAAGLGALLLAGPGRLCLWGVAALWVSASLGFASAQFATARAPPFDPPFPSRATIVTGVVRAVEVLPEGRRITLEQVRLDSDALPRQRYVRLRMHRSDQTELSTGDTVRVRALVRAPAPPSYPGGWDMQRDWFYSGLGGSGFALNPVEVQGRAMPGRVALLVERLREAIGSRILAAVPGAAGGVSVAILTGTMSAIPEADRVAFRDSGLAHLLSVSGLHISLVMGFAMSAVRLVFALSERASLMWPTKRLAALIALAVGGFYMVLSGAQVPIVRSFAMASLVTLGLMLGRRAVSLRALALAVVVVLLMDPEELPGPSLQMSFSAVLALISGYEAMRPWLRRLHGHSWGTRAVSYVLALVLTSVLAGTASAPYGAYHFGHTQVYFVVSNMVAVPLAGAWVMPAGMIGLALMPVGLDQLVLPVMGWGVGAILWVARTTAAWPASTLAVPHLPLWGLAVLSFGIVWTGIWRSRLRLFGLLPLTLGLASPAFDRPPDVLVSADARLIGFRTAEGVFLQTHNGGSKFTRDTWLRYWSAAEAAPLPAEGEAAGGAVACLAQECLVRAEPASGVALLVRGAAHPAGCRGAAVIVSAEPARGLCPKPWPQLVDRFTVWRNGAVAVWLAAGRARIVTDREERGARPWVPGSPVPKPRPRPALPMALPDTGLEGGYGND
jgi:competence protein ComEC